jgi:hypothetical protein
MVLGHRGGKSTRELPEGNGALREPGCVSFRVARRVGRAGAAASGVDLDLVLARTTQPSVALPELIRIDATIAASCATGNERRERRYEDE